MARLYTLNPAERPSTEAMFRASLTDAPDVIEALEECACAIRGIASIAIGQAYSGRHVSFIAIGAKACAIACLDELLAKLNTIIPRAE